MDRAGPPPLDSGPSLQVPGKPRDRTDRTPCSPRPPPPAATFPPTPTVSRAAGLGGSPVVCVFSVLKMLLKYS